MVRGEARPEDFVLSEHEFDYFTTAIIERIDRWEKEQKTNQAFAPL